MEILLNEKLNEKEFFPDILDDPQKRVISARYGDDLKSQLRSMTVEPTSIHGSFESVGGVNVEYFEDDEIFRKLIKLTNIFRKDFNINEINRCGFRFKYIENLRSSPEKVNKAFKIIVNNKLSQGADTILGGIKDFVIAFDGEDRDKIKYHFKCGPYFKGEAAKYFKYISTKFDESCVKDFIIDLDLYEEKFNLSKDVSFGKWCSPMIKKAWATFDYMKLLLTDYIED